MEKRKITKKFIKSRPQTLWGLVVIIILVFLTGSSCSSVSTRLKMDPESESFYQQAHFLFTKHEQKTFNNLASPEARKRFIEYFWDIRDPNPYADENEFKLLMDERFNFVKSYLKEGNIPGWKTDRGRIYMLLGPPDYVETQSVFNNPNVHGYVFWAYGEEAFYETDTRNEGLYILFVDRDGHGRYYINFEGISIYSGADYQYIGGTNMRLLDEAEEMKYKFIHKKGELFEKNNLDFQITYNKDNENLHIAIKPKNIIFDENAQTGGMTAKFKIDMIVYEGNENFFKQSEIKTIDVKKEELLTPKEQDFPNSPLQLDIPVKLKAGQITVDVFISDLLGDAAHRELFTFNI
ncbi:MAG: GWxTD domain-containing protein [Acidobacteria bacterium]|jgi:GWxTD domain-containing protein|nr:GWxTD domain-containing protein [Acidobacteriota bacterium]